MAFTAKSRSGFTLIEISMVLMLFAAAVGALLTFFPVGLRLERNALSDTAQTMFAINVLGQIEANAEKLDWDEWQDNKNFFTKSDSSGILVGNLDGGQKGQYIKGVGEGKLKSYLLRRTTMKYEIRIFDVTYPYDVGGADSGDASRLKRVVIWVTDNGDGNPRDFTPFSTDLFYKGKVSALENTGEGK